MGRDNRAAKGLLSAAAVCAALLGCATTKTFTPVNCNGGSCDVDVHVDIQGSTCTVSAPDINNTGANNIFWNIDRASKDAGYRFPATAVHAGVWIKDPPPSGCKPPDNVFDSPDRQTDWKFKLHNKGTRGTYCYGVQVVRNSAPTPCTLDPQIVNN
jgi:hypothetical protein